jgi:hypothetical protein
MILNMITNKINLNSGIFHKLVILVLLNLITSCDQGGAKKSKNNDTTEKTKLHSIHADQNSINSYNYTLGEISDLFDENLTIENCKSFFDVQPLVVDEGDLVTLKYAVNSNDLYENGMRISTIEIEFKKGKFMRSSVGFTSYSD